MSQSLGSIKLKSFEGTANIHGTEREVAFVPDDGSEPGVLLIRGVGYDDAVHIINALEGGLLKGKDAEQPKTQMKFSEPGTEQKSTNGVKAETKKADKPAKVIDAKSEEKKPEPPKQETKAVEVEDASEDVSDDLGDDEDTGLEQSSDLDVPTMAKMEKLRPVIEHMIAKGFNTPKAILEASQRVKGLVPALMEVEKKGEFDKRIDRAAQTVLGGMS